MAHVCNKLIIFSLTVLLGSIIYKNELKSLFYTSPTNNENRVNGAKIFSPEELARYNGIHETKLYLSVLGTVFDVTKGTKHYKHGRSYHYFIGKDGSRALITGNFQDDSDNRDHVLDLQCNGILALLNWKNTFKEKYVEIGSKRDIPRLWQVEVHGLCLPRQETGVMLCMYKKDKVDTKMGRYFDQNAMETTYSDEFRAKVNRCKYEHEIARKKDLEYPPCNIAWSADDGTKVWCTNTSGGVTRSWAGVPRQMYNPGEEKPLCVCVNLIKKGSDALLKQYDSCPSTSTTCIVDIS